MKEQVARAKRIAGAAAAITLLMIGVKAAVGAAARSTALLADAVHSGADLLAVATSWFGLRLASKEPTERFPYGFYRAETFAALVVSTIILYLSGALLWTGIRRLNTVPTLFHPAAAMVTAVLSAGVALALSTWEKRTSRQTGSQSLNATGDETRLDAVTSLLVFAALLAANLKVPVFEGAVTIVISALVLWAGIRNARISILSLMDASVDPNLEREIAAMLLEMPEVHYVEKVRARRSGPFYFVEGHVHVAGSMDVVRSHALSHDAQRAIRQKKPQVESVILHVEPYREQNPRVALPVVNIDGTFSEIEQHFGRAGWFLIATFRGKILSDRTVETNPFQTKRIRAGLAAINWLVSKKKISAVIVRELGEIAYHALRDKQVEVFRSPGASVEDALREFAAAQLEHLPAPTHSSELGLASKDGDDKRIRESIQQSLSKVIDPETGVDVLTMGLVRDIKVSDGRVTLTFRPSSHISPLAFRLATDIREALRGIAGVQEVKIKVENFDKAEELESLLRNG